MLIQVQLLQYSDKTFTYSVPEHLRANIARGVLVQVPLVRRIVPAVIAEILSPDKTFNFVIKPICSIYPFPQDHSYASFITTIGQYYQIDSSSLLRRIEQFLSEKEHSDNVAISGLVEQTNRVVTFTYEQQQVLNEISPYVEQKKHQTFVLHGVTGSGKTEIYKQLAKKTLEQGRSVIIMLPEVSLALRFEKIFAQFFQGTPVIGFHSASPVRQKRLLWKSLLEKQPIIILGVHLPALLPIANLGLIVVDEEHDHGYQEKKHPKIHSRDMAILKASMHDVPIVLGSATPSLQSLWNVQKRGWKLLHMRQRFAGNFPKVEVVSLQKTNKRKQFWITDQLYSAIEDRLSKGEQTIIFLNRRGYSFFVQCPCSYVFSCHQCSVSLTLHQDQSLLCHYCGYKERIPTCCPSCSGHQDEFLKKGIGTQQVVSILQKLFPNARIERADMDTTTKKRSWAQTVDQMQQGEVDILVGTQSITKGYHFPGVTLVGVLWADLNLHFPMYNAAETSLQQLIQVAGRAGRQSFESLVIIQAFDKHPIFDFLDEVKYQSFYDEEIQKRIEVGYPPFKHIAEIEMKGSDQAELDSETQFVMQWLQQNAMQQDSAHRSISELINDKSAVLILGPIQSMVFKVKSIYAQKIFLKSFSRSHMINLFAKLPKQHLQSSIFFTIDPVA